MARKQNQGERIAELVANNQLHLADLVAAQERLDRLGRAATAVLGETRLTSALAHVSNDLRLLIRRMR